jgi:hypothetical protein
MDIHKKVVDIAHGVGDKAPMFAKTRQFAVMGRLRAAARLRDVNAGLVLVLVLIILPGSGVSVFA